MSTHTLLTPRGNPATFDVRDDTSDLSVLGSVYSGVAGAGLVDEYDLQSLQIEPGGVFVDVGAHIGAVAIAVLLDNPGTFALLVEPIPENLVAIERNLALNGLSERATVIDGAVGTGVIHYGWDANDTLHTNRYIGNLNTPLRAPQTVKVRRVTMSDLLPAAAMKVDCEGGEWALFADPRVREVPTVFGEYHGEPGIDGVLTTFNQTHSVSFRNAGPTVGNFVAVAK